MDMNTGLITTIKQEYDKYARYDYKTMATFRYLTELLCPYSILILDDEMMYSLLVKNEYVDPNFSPNTEKNYRQKIRFVQRFFRLNKDKHEDWFMMKMNLLEVIEYWMLNPEQEFVNGGGRVYHMNKYGLIENKKGDVLTKNPDMLSREWMIV